MGLMTGLVILIMQRYMSADAVHQLLTFNPADFFTCAGLRLRCQKARCHALLQQALLPYTFAGSARACSMCHGS